jgi:diadenosine tetraphosphate (Ap4A) HIT family hydrolase
MDKLPLSSLATPNATLVKFGFPASCLHLGQHWAVLVRPAQPTLGSLVLCSTSELASYGALPADALREQGEIVARIENMLSEFIKYEKINYLMLMMVDPHVHFHVLPRYSGARSFEGQEFRDSGWPALPDLGNSHPSTSGLINALTQSWNDTE